MTSSKLSMLFEGYFEAISKVLPVQKKRLSSEVKAIFRVVVGATASKN